MGVFHRIALHGRHHQFGTPPEEQERAALMLYFGQTLLGTAMSVTGKLCSAAGMHFFFLVLVRSATLCLLLAPLLLKHKCNPFKLNRSFPLLMLRGFCGFASLSLWYLSLTQLPLSDAMALSFVSPVLVAITAPVLLGETTPPAVYWSIPACLAGMLMVAQPTWLFGSAAVATSSLGVAAGLLQALASTGGKLTIRALNKHKEPLDSILFSMGFVSLLGAAVGCLVLPGAQLTTQQGHSAASWGYLAATSALAFVVQLAFTAAMRGCSASSAASLDYLSLLWTLIADALIFRKLPSCLSLAGAAVIAVSSLAAIVWTSTHAHGGAAAGGQRAAEEEQAAPLTYKKTFYSADDDAGACACHGGSEDESTSLLAAVGRRDKAAGRGDVVRLVASAAATAPRSFAVALSPSPGKHATLAALPPALSDSSKSWKQGASAAAAASEDGGPALPLTHATEGAAASVPPALELRVVLPGPPGMRTSSEKEAALQAAGK